jgi:hypothetical protein
MATEKGETAQMRALRGSLRAGGRSALLQGSLQRLNCTHGLSRGSAPSLEFFTPRLRTAQPNRFDRRIERSRLRFVRFIELLRDCEQTAPLSKRLQTL